MKVWRRRRRTRVDDASPLTPAQVKAMRSKGERLLSRVIFGYIVVSALGAIAMASFFLRVPEGHRILSVTGFALAVVYFVALGYSRVGYEVGASIVVYLSSIGAIALVVSHVSSALSLESYLFGLALMPFIFVRKEWTALRFALAGTGIAVYLLCELAWPAGMGAAEIDPALVNTVASVNRLGAAALLVVAAVVVELRHASMVRVLAGAARYGELRATTDELTGVYNRRPVIAQLSEWAARGRGNYAIALIDIDHFKNVNDDYGHDCGDTIIQTVATTLRAHFRDTDMVSRWGGDEFLILMPGVRHSDVMPVLERLRRAISLIEKRCSGHVHTVTVSVGAAMGSIGQTPDECIAAADHALYRAKEEGRNRVVAVGIAEPHQALGRPESDEVTTEAALATEPS